MPVMKILDQSGHRSFEWDAHTDLGVHAAGEKFANLKAEGRVPFAVGPSGESPVQIHAFDPMLTTDVIWIRPIAGG